jgi:hypothetical protein
VVVPLFLVPIPGDGSSSNNLDSKGVTVYTNLSVGTVSETAYEQYGSLSQSVLIILYSKPRTLRFRYIHPCERSDKPSDFAKC